MQARNVWRQTVHQTSAPEVGCFHASFPSTAWEKVECGAAPAYHSVRVTADAARVATEGTPAVIGNGSDFVAQAPTGHFFSSVLGYFPQTDVESETGVGVAAFGGGGNLGPNQYTLQLNTDQHYTAACDGYKKCKAWTQYVLSSSTDNKTLVFVQDWLENYGVHEGSHNICPRGYVDAGRDSNGGEGDDCVQNSEAAIIKSGTVAITKLVDLALGGSAKKGGNDEATAFYDKDAYKVSIKDSMTDIATEWSQAEFNVVGNGDGSRADFSQGTELEVQLDLDYGSKTTPKCQTPSKRLGTTGETNNLSPGECAVRGGSDPAMAFIEGN